MDKQKIAVLYVDDEANNLISFRATFRLKYKVYTAISGDDALKVLEEHEVHVIISDQRMPNMTGVEFFERVLANYTKPVRILLTGYADMSAIIDAVNKGKIFHYLTKPWAEEDLSGTIDRAFEVYLEKEKILALNVALERSNEQLEFLLRQKLLS